MGDEPTEVRRIRLGLAALLSFMTALHVARPQLFLSMIPLHADNPGRQLTLFANGLRLFHAFFGRR